MTIKETKELEKALKDAAIRMAQQEKTQVCANLDISLISFTRYTSGSLKGRKIAFAELLLKEIKKVMAAYQQAQKVFKSAATA